MVLRSQTYNSVYTTRGRNSTNDFHFECVETYLCTLLIREVLEIRVNEGPCLNRQGGARSLRLLLPGFNRIPTVTHVEILL